MDNRISEIRKQIRALRVSMIEAEAIMRAQINRDESCAFVAGDLLKMRAVMSVLVRERAVLGDREPILVNRFFVPRRAPAPRPVAVRPVNCQLVPAVHMRDREVRDRRYREADGDDRQPAANRILVARPARRRASLAAS